MVDLIAHFEYFYNTLDCGFHTENPFKTPKSYQAIHNIAQKGDSESYFVESSSLKNNSHFVKIGDQTVSRLEFEATQNVTLGMCSLLLFATPWIISTILVMICQTNLDYSVVMEECSNYEWGVRYTKEFLIIHSIYQSIFYLVRSKDFSAAIGHR